MNQESSAAIDVEAERLFFGRGFRVKVDTGYGGVLCAGIGQERVRDAERVVERFSEERVIERLQAFYAATIESRDQATERGAA